MGFIFKMGAIIVLLMMIHFEEVVNGEALKKIAMLLYIDIDYDPCENALILSTTHMLTIINTVTYM